MKPDIIVYDINLTRVGVLDDYAELTTQRSWRETGTATVTINRDMPNATLLTEGAILIIGDDPKDSFKVVSLQDSIDSDGKVSQMLVATCEDLRCLLKQRLIMDLDEDGFYSDSNPAETVIKNLVTSQCVSSSDSARNFSTLTVAADQARGMDAVINTKYTSVYDACVSVSKQSNIGWYIYPDVTTGEYILDCAIGVDRTASVFFDYNFESLQSADYTEDIRSYRNLAYVGGAGSGIDREIYTGFTEDTEPAGFDRFETFIDAGNINTEAELQARAEGTLEELQVSSSVSMDGLQKSPFIYKENYNCGDVVTVRFNDHTIQVRLYVVSESWMPGEYDIGFEVGKPRPDIRDQIGQISSSISNNSAGSEAGTNNTGMRQGVLTMPIASGYTMNAAECIYNILMLTGTLVTDVNVILHIDTATFIGRKAYHIVFTATSDESPKVVTIKTSVAGTASVQATIPVSNAGFYIDVVVDGAGNVYKQVAVYSAESATSDKWKTARNISIADADGTNTGTAVSVDGSENETLKLPSTINASLTGNASTATALETARKINNVPFDGTADIVTQESPPTPWAQYSGKDIPQLPDNLAGTTFIRDGNWSNLSGFSIDSAIASYVNGKLRLTATGIYPQIYQTSYSSYSGKVLMYRIKKISGSATEFIISSGGSTKKTTALTTGTTVFDTVVLPTLSANLVFLFNQATVGDVYEIESSYIGTGAYDRLVFDNSYHYRHLLNNAVIPTPQGLYFNGATSYLQSKEKITLPDVFTFSATVNCAIKSAGQVLFAQGNYTATPFLWFYRYTSSNNLYIRGSDGTQAIGVQDVLNFFTGLDNTNIEVEVTFDFINKTLDLYRNKVKFGSTLSLGTMVKPVADYIYIGSSVTLTNSILGYMRNIQLYDTALTDTQRNWLAQGNTPPILYDVTNYELESRTGSYSTISLTTATSSILPKGDFMLTSSSGDVQLQMYNGISTWVGVSQAVGYIKSDGINYRVYNANASTQTVYIRKLL